MARMKPPKGYYTLTEAAKLLNISNAMVRRYVEKGNIKYLLPEGREHGFYLKKDVDELYNKLNAFLSTSDEEELNIELYPAREEELKDIARIGNALFNTRNSLNIPKWRYELFNKNKESQLVLKVNRDIKGFATLFPLKIDSPNIDKLMKTNTVSDANIDFDDIENYEEGKHIHLYIGAIGLDPALNDDKMKHRYGAALVSRLINTIISLGKRGIVIEEISAIGATTNGIRILQSFGLHEIPAKVPGNRAFTMNIKESGSPISMQYKEALAEWEKSQEENYKH